MGHYNTAKALFRAGADPFPPNGLFRNIWDTNELRSMIKNVENYSNAEYFLPSLLEKAADQFMNMGQTRDAEEMSRRAVEGYEKILGPEHTETLSSVNRLALVLQYQGKYEAAEEMNRRALEGYEKALGAEHPDTLNSVYCLAYLFHIQQRYDDASVLYLRAVEKLSKILGPDHPTTLKCSKQYTSMVHEMERHGKES